MLATRKPSMPTRVRHSSIDGSDTDGLPGVDSLAERLGGAASLATSASGSLTEDAWSPNRSHRDMVRPQTHATRCIGSSGIGGIGERQSHSPLGGGAQTPMPHGKVHVHAAGDVLGSFAVCGSHNLRQLHSGWASMQGHSRRSQCPLLLSASHLPQLHITPAQRPRICMQAICSWQASLLRFAGTARAACGVGQYTQGCPAGLLHRTYLRVETGASLAIRQQLLLRMWADSCMWLTYGNTSPELSHACLQTACQWPLLVSNSTTHRAHGVTRWRWVCPFGPCPSPCWLCSAG